MTTPPVARVDVVRETYFGTTVEDPYRWMEEWEGEESRAFIEGQGAYARAMLDSIPERRELLARIVELRDRVPILLGFRVAGGRSFYLRRDPTENVPRLVVRITPDAPERTLIDPNAIEGEAHTSIDWYHPSRDGRLVAYGASPGGSENSVLRVLDVDTGETLADEIDRTQFSAFGVYWLEDNRSFLYHRLRDLPPDAPPVERYLDSRCYLHRLGDDPDEDQSVFGFGVTARVEVARHDLGIAAVSPTSRWAIGVVLHGVLNERTLYAVLLSDLLQDPAACPWRKIADVEDAIVGAKVDGDTLYLRTHTDAPRYRIIAVDLREPDLAAARSIVPQSDVVIQDMEVVGKYLLTADLDAGINRLRRTPLAGGEPEDVPLPIQGVMPAWTSEPGSSEILLQLQSWTESPRVFRYDVEASVVEDTCWVEASPIDMSEIEVHESTATAPDGVEVPLTIIYRKGLKRDGSNPTLLRGYGSYGLNFPVQYLPQMQAWYERGGVLAVARLRGGGELGREWHDAGRFMNKGNTIGDFIAGAEHLIKEGYTSPDRIAGEGTSAGGIPSGGALIRRPDLWAAMVMRVAVTDALRISLTPGGPANIPEFGDPSTEEGFRSISLIDSYRKVRDGERYPAVLLTTGLNDPRVVAWQATKMTARLQVATASGKPVLMRVETQGGHGIGSTKRQQDEELADELAFLLWQFGLSEQS